WSSDGTKIAWGRYANTDYDIWVMDANGTNPVDLTNNAAQDLNPSWRPGTTTIAFDTNRDGDSEIYTINADGTGLTDGSNSHATGEYAPDWSPDGSKLAFSGSGQIKTMLANGTGVTALTTLGGSEPAWAPDSSRLAFTSGRDMRNDIFVMDANGANQKHLTTN